MSKLLRSLFCSSSSTSDEDVQVLPTRVAPALSVYKFAKDLQERHPDEFRSAKFIKVYFFTDKSVHEVTRTAVYGRQHFNRRYLYIRPELIAFSSMSPDRRLINKVMECVNEYQTHGIYINYNGESEWQSSFQASHELKTGYAINCITINPSERSYVKRGENVNYFRWDIIGVSSSSSASRHLMENVYDEVEQFSVVADEDDDGELTFE